MIDTLIRDLRFAGRMLAKRPGMTLVAVLSLALGVGANTAIFSLINEVFLQPLPIEDADRVVAIFTTDERAGGQSAMSHLNWRDVREQNETFEEVAGYDFVGMAISTGDEPTLALGFMVSGNYFDTLGVRPAAGRFFLADEDSAPGAHPVAVLHHSFWTEEMGADEEAIGRTITINGSSFTVVGVAPSGFDGLNVGIEPALWVPMAMNPVIRPDAETNWYEERRGLFVRAFGRLEDGVSIEAAQANLGIIAERLEREYPDDNEGRGILIRPIAETTVFNRGGVARGAALLMTTVGIVLLIACANVANLLLAQAAERRKEIALRLALGISRTRLLRQLLTESVLISLLGGAVGLAIAFLARGWIAQGLGNLPGANLQLGLELDGRVLLFTFLLCIGTGILFGLLPALQSSRPQLVSVLKDQGGGIASPGRRITARNLLVIAQLALSLVALVGAGLFVRSLGAARDIDLGYSTDNLVVAGFDVGLIGFSPEQGEQFYRQALEGVASLPGVESAALVEAGPLQGSFLRSVILEGENPEERTFVQVSAAGAGYFETMGIPIEAGRGIGDQDRPGSVEVVVVNRTMANKYWPGQNPLGKRFRFFGREPVEVVGVARDIKYNNPGEDPQPYAYLPLAQYYVTRLNIVARTQADPGPVLLATQSELREMNQDLVINANTGAGILQNGVGGQRMMAIVLAVFGGIALVLAAIGIYGVMSYAVRAKRREIGIRMALGAEEGGVLTMVLREGLILTALGLGIGVVVGLGVTRLMTQLLLVSPSDPLTFVGTVAVLLLVAMLACLVPAWRAKSVDPIVVLRAD